ncbi:IS3 family transposase, partial [Paracoccus liaowanqingii]|uniref:IS3 family transposase n=1 Tax=Paracoccus liaowanqingii TaxID=2560053 RepID=UPI001F104576
NAGVGMLNVLEGAEINSTRELFERAGNVWDNSAMESFFSTPKTERTARKVYRPRNEARADVFDYIERFYNPRRHHSKLGCLSPMEFEARAMRA